MTEPAERLKTKVPISFFVRCETQQEIDYFWKELSAGGEEGRCGWLKDKFGVSWQIVPPILGELLGDEDEAKSQSVMQAMFKMSKLDIAALKRAHRIHQATALKGGRYAIGSKTEEEADSYERLVRRGT
jgi:hypothetical protein